MTSQRQGLCGKRKALGGQQRGQPGVTVVVLCLQGLGGLQPLTEAAQRPQFTPLMP